MNVDPLLLLQFLPSLDHDGIGSLEDPGTARSISEVVEVEATVVLVNEVELRSEVLPLEVLYRGELLLPVAPRGDALPLGKLLLTPLHRGELLIWGEERTRSEALGDDLGEFRAASNCPGSTAGITPPPVPWCRGELRPRPKLLPPDPPEGDRCALARCSLSRNHCR